MRMNFEPAKRVKTSLNHVIMHKSRLRNTIESRNPFNHNDSAHVFTLTSIISFLLVHIYSFRYGNQSVECYSLALVHMKKNLITS